MSRNEYFAYGSNLNFEQMAYRCPEATVVGTAKLDGYELAFRRGYLTICPKREQALKDCSGLSPTMTNPSLTATKATRHSMTRRP